MKKLILLATLVVALPSFGLQPYVRSFLNPGVAALAVTNNYGVTNLNYVAQNLVQGLYVVGSNAVQGNLVAPIATNVVFTAYTNIGTMNNTNGVVLPELVVITNNLTTYGVYTNTGAVIITSPGTNAALPGLGGGANFFQDVPISPDMFTLYGSAATLGAAGATNNIGVLTVVSVPDGRVAAGATAGSNAVTLVFEGIPNMAGGISPAGSLIGLTPNLGSPASSYGLAPTDGAYFAGQQGLTTWSLTYTNQISTIGMETVAAFPVPAWRFADCQAIRLRSATAANSTNAVWITSISLTGWTP